MTKKYVNGHLLDLEDWLLLKNIADKLYGERNDGWEAYVAQEAEKYCVGAAGGCPKCQDAKFEKEFQKWEMEQENN